MKTVTASEARMNLYKLIDETAVTSEPRETMHLLSIPGMRASIRKGMRTPIKECLELLDW